MTTPPKFRITLFKPRWWQPWADHQVMLQKFDGRTRTYKSMPATEVGVRDIHGLNDIK